MSETVYIGAERSPGLSNRITKLIRETKLLCERLGFKVYSRALSSDPDQPDPALGETVEARTHRLFVSDLLLLILCDMSVEAGWDIRLAERLGLPIIIVCDPAMLNKDKLSGIPGCIDTIPFRNHKQAMDDVTIALLRWQWNTVCG